MINSPQQLVRMNYLYLIPEVAILGEDVEHFLGLHLVLSDDRVELDHDLGHIFVLGDDFVQWLDHGVGHHLGLLSLVGRQLLHFLCACNNINRSRHKFLKKN